MADPIVFRVTTTGSETPVLMNNDPQNGQSDRDYNDLIVTLH